MQQDNSEMETSHEKEYIYLIIITIITVVCIIAGSLYHIGALP